MEPAIRPPSVALWALLALLTSCGEPDPPAQSPGAGESAGTENRFGFEVWKADFPFPVHLSPPAPAGVYRLSSRDALERVIANLQGNCTREAWMMAMRFFGRAPAEAIPMLIAAMDRAMQSRHLADVVQNTVEAMGQMGAHRSPELATALLRALRHPKESVQNSAMAALVSAGTPDAVREARRHLGDLQVRARADWIRAARRHLPTDEVVEIYRELIHSDRFTRVFGIVVEEGSRLPPDAAARLLEPMWPDARGELRLTIACTLHAVGDLRGTRYLQDVMRGGDPASKVTAVQSARLDVSDHLRDDVLRLSVDQDANVRYAVALAIGELPGENIDNILSTLAVDLDDAVRRAALALLRARGAREHLDRLIQRVRTASGTKLVHALTDLSAAGDGQAIPAMLERMRSSPPEERRKFVQAIGRSQSTEAFDALREVFLAPETPVDEQGRTSISYTALVLANLSASADRIMQLYRELPRDDYRRRASLLFTLGDMASVSNDAEFAAGVHDLLREVLRDATEIPQMRLLALDYLRSALVLDDVGAIRALQDAEQGPMRGALTAFLYEFF